MVSTLRTVVLGALFIIPFVALYVANEAFFPFITGKAFAFRILVEIAFAGWIALACADKQYRPKFSWTFLLYGAFALWMMVADFFAVNPHKAFWSNFERMDGWVTLIHVFMFFVVAGAMLAKESVRLAWWRTFIAASALACGVALLQIMGVYAINQGGLRVDATFGNAIYFAVFLMFSLGITLWQATLSKGWIRYCLLTFAVIQIGFMLLTASRGALIATFGAAAFAAVWSVWKLGGKARKLGIGVLITLAVVVGGFFLIRDTAFVKDQPIIARVASVFSINEELSIRFSVWSMAGEAAIEKPLLGWGQEGFMYVFNKYYDPSLFAAEPYYDRAHNTYLDWLVAGGIPALLLFLGLLLSTVIALFRYQLSSGERLVLLSLLVGYGIQALVVFDNLFTYVPLAIIFATAHVISSRPIKALENQPVASERILGAAVVPVAAAVAAAMVWVVNVPNIAAAQDLIKAQQPASSVSVNLEGFNKTIAHGSFATQEIAEQLATFSVRVAQEPSIDNATKIQFLTLAIDQLNAELAHVPNDVRTLLMLASVYRAGGDIDSALAAINAAASASPKRQIVYMDLGSTQWLAGQQEAARASFQKAYQLDTRYNDPIIFLAASQIISGDLAGGKAALNEKFGTTTIDNAVLWNAFVEAQDYNELVWIQELRIRNNPNAGDLQLMLARVYAVGGKIAEARALIEVVAAKYPAYKEEAAALLLQVSGQ